MPQRSFQLRPISEDDAARLRAEGGQVYTADAHPGFPCRQCLRDATVGEELILVSHDPFFASSPYRSASPIFLHRHACEPSDLSALPQQLTRRELSVRAFDDAEMMTDAEVIEGATLAATLDRFFADDATVRVRIHNAERGCWATDVERNPARTS